MPKRQAKPLLGDERKERRSRRRQHDAFQRAPERAAQQREGGIAERAPITQPVTMNPAIMSGAGSRPSTIPAASERRWQACRPAARLPACRYAPGSGRAPPAASTMRLSSMERWAGTRAERSRFSARQQPGHQGDQHEQAQALGEGDPRNVRVGAQRHDQHWKRSCTDENRAVVRSQPQTRVR